MNKQTSKKHTEKQTQMEKYKQIDHPHVLCNGDIPYMKYNYHSVRTSKPLWYV